MVTSLNIVLEQKQILLSPLFTDLNIILTCKVTAVFAQIYVLLLSDLHRTAFDN